MRSSQETLVSLLMLCKLPISSLEFFTEKRARKKRSLRNTITQPEVLQAPSLWHPARQQGPSAAGTVPSCCAHSERSGASDAHVSLLPLAVSSPYAVYLQCSLMYKCLYTENTRQNKRCYDHRHH